MTTCGQCGYGISDNEPGVYFSNPEPADDYGHYPLEEVCSIAVDTRSWVEEYEPGWLTCRDPIRFADERTQPPQGKGEHDGC